MGVIKDILLFLLKFTWYFVEGIGRLFIPVPEKSVKGEIVLITGSGHGIGKELALQYASHGATVVCWDINKKGNEQTVKEISELGYPKAHAYECNVANREQVVETAKKVQKEVGDVTILVNNAGIMPCHPLLDHTPDEIQRIMNINVLGHFWTVQAFLPTMLKNNKGHIVAVCSGCALVGLRNLVPYCASKSALLGLMDALYQELHVDPKCEIKLTNVMPYMVNTGLCKKPKIRFDKLMPLLEPRDVAKHIIWAQRRNMVETTVPRELLSVYYYGKLFPIKAWRALQDFMDFYVDSDL